MVFLFPRDGIHSLNKVEKDNLIINSIQFTFIASLAFSAVPLIQSLFLIYGFALTPFILNYWVSLPSIHRFSIRPSRMSLHRPCTGYSNLGHYRNRRSIDEGGLRTCCLCILSCELLPFQANSRILRLFAVYIDSRLQTISLEVFKAGRQTIIRCNNRCQKPESHPFEREQIGKLRRLMPSCCR